MTPEHPTDSSQNNEGWTPNQQPALEPSEAAASIDSAAAQEPATRPSVLADNARETIKSLHTKRRANFGKENTEIAREAENIAALRVSVEDIVEQYAGIFADRIPPASQNDRNWRGKLKTRPQEVKWEETEKGQHHDFGYDFNLIYQPGERYNDIEQVGMTVTASGAEVRRKPSFGVELTYKKRELSTLKVSWRDQGEGFKAALGEKGADELMAFLTENNMLEDTTDKGMVFNSFTIDVKGMAIELDASAHGLIGPPSKTEVYTRGRHLSTFRYDAQNNQFPEIKQEQSLRDQAAPPTVLEADDFRGILSDTLKLIPVIEQESPV